MTTTSGHVPIIDRIAWPLGVVGAISGRATDPREVGTSYGTANLALHVGDDAEQVDAHRRDLMGQLAGGDANPLTLVALRADHGRAVRVIGTDVGTEAPAHYDGLVTARTDVALLSMAADCVPVAFADPEAGVIGVAHAGWRGTAAGVLDATLAAMGQLGAVAARTFVHLGPAACGHCYEVGPDVVDALGASDGAPTDSSWHTASDAGRHIVDLRALLRAQAIARGIDPAAVTLTDRCTIEDPQLYSHRRDGVRGPTGRHGLLLRRQGSAA